MYESRRENVTEAISDPVLLGGDFTAQLTRTTSLRVDSEFRHLKGFRLSLGLSANRMHIATHSLSVGKTNTDILEEGRTE